MAITNNERVGKALDLLKIGLEPFVRRELEDRLGKEWAFEVRNILADTRLGSGKSDVLNDVSVLLVIMDRKWGDVFRITLGKSERSLVNELIDVRNRWAHQKPFSSDDAYRALDSAARLLNAVSAGPQADDLEKSKQELLRVRYDEQARGERRKAAGSVLESSTTGGLKPWREIVTPHEDVAGGRYQQAEFAADLWQVHLGEGTAEYRDPREFFRRTYVTESLRGMLVTAVKRLAKNAGDPVLQLQTNFGGGKTHSMLALYHLFSGIAPTELAGMGEVLTATEVDALPKVRRVVLVGNKISPGNPVTKADGTVVRTLWGELAWQLGGKSAYQRIAADDAQATSPGDRLRELFNDYGPCLVLIDEWVAYARQLHDQSNLPAGSFETQFTFAQALTESAKLAKNCLLVISLPMSDTTGVSPSQADDVEVGGIRGREALDRLRNVVGRVESSWRPASAEEGFEIVRRRLFQPLTDPAHFKQRDAVVRAFADFYHAQQAEFPPEAREKDYEKRMQAAYPIHPEIFDRLYGDWSTLVKFQRTRGVLRLMAAVIHNLWEKGDQSPLILPAHIALDEPRVQTELTRYLSDNWVPVIEKDVDGPNSLPLRLEQEQPGTLGKYSACRRVARAVYLGSAPTGTAAHKGLEDRRIKLGCVMPGEPPATFGDALRHLANRATYLYQDGPHYWYSTQATVTKTAEDRAEQLKREPDKVQHEIEQLLRKNLAAAGDFERIHPLPQSGADVPDDFDARLVVLGTDHPYSKEAGSPAETAAKAILEMRGNIPRLFRNTLVFLAADRNALQSLDQAAREHLAWQSILADEEQLGLTTFQKRQVEQKLRDTTSTLTTRLPETYKWLLVPTQGDPRSALTLQAMGLKGDGALALRASKKLRSDDHLYVGLGGSVLRLTLDRIPLWRDRGELHHDVSVRQLVEDFAKYPYLPRLKNPSVLCAAISDGISLLTWEKDGFAYAEGYDEAASRYRGLRVGKQVSLTPENNGLLVKSDVARKQIETETPSTTGGSPPGVPPDSHSSAGSGPQQPLPPPPGMPPPPPKPRRFHGSVDLDPERVGRDASKIAEEVITHLVGLMRANVRVTLEISADIPEGTPEQVVRTVTENGRTLKFSNMGFELE